MEAEKINLASKLCNVLVDSFYRSNYTLFKNFTVFFKSTLQSFTRKDYGVTGGYFSICSGKLSLSCNDYLVKVKYREQYKVFKNFSLSYHKKHYDYREYRLRDDTFELCSFNDSRVQDFWKTQNSWEKDWYKHYPCLYYTIKKFAYVVGKHFSVFFAGSAQSFEKHEYIVRHGQLYICSEKLKPETPNFSKEDMLLCNDSIIKVKFDEKYKVWTSFSIFYENKVYDFTEYRILNDSISICNSTDKYVQESWKLRNGWVKKERHFLSCKRRPIKIVSYQKPAFTVLKDFSVRLSLTKQVILNSEYGVFEGKVQICVEKLTEYLYVDHIKLTMIAPFCALALSIICLLLLFIVYSVLPELRTLPGLNLVSLSFAFFLFLTSVAFVVLLHVRVGELFEIPWPGWK